MGDQYDAKKKLFFSFFILSLMFGMIIAFNNHDDCLNFNTELSRNKDKINAFKKLTQIVDFQELSNQINSTYFNNIVNHIDNLSSFGSRVTGYPGYEQTANYIENFFRSQDLENVTTVNYPLVVPIDYGTNIIVNDQNYTAYSLMPNLVHTSSTPSNGISGTLVYGASGAFTDLDGKKIQDSLVVLEFNTRSNWLKVASLGAKGVIFLKPNNTDRFEAEEKTIDIPLNFLRVYIENSTTAQMLRTLAQYQNETITLHSSMKWESIEAKNVLGLFPGLDEDIIILSAYYDSSSVVPLLSPGADEACGIATLMELIRIMNDNNIVPQKTIMFLALSGHNQAAAGAREFVFQKYASLNTPSGVKLFISLDLSATNYKIGINPYGYLNKFKLQFTTGNNLVGRMKNIGEDYLLNYASEIFDSTGYSFEVKSYINLQNFEDIAPIPFIGDQEPFVASNVIGLSLFTAESHRLQYNTPFDLLSYLNLENLKSEVVYAMCSLTELVNEPELGGNLDLQHKTFNLKHTTHVGYANIEGYCKEYNETSAWFSNVNGAIIRVISFEERSGSYGFYPYYTMTDETGYYQIHGVSSSQPDYPLDFITDAYYFNASGKMVKSINLGSHGQSFKRSNKLTSRTTTINPTVFDCGTLAFFDVVQPYTQAPAANSLSFQILDPETRSPFFSYGYIGTQSVCLIFVPPDSSSVIVGQSPEKILAIYATNSTQEVLKGNGYTVTKGEFRNLGIAAFATSRDLQSMTTTYIELYSSYNIYDALVDQTYQSAINLITTAKLLMSNYEYSKALVTIKEAQSWSYDAFRQARNVIEDGTSTTIFFAILLLPFSFALSSLLFNFESGMKRVVATSLIYGLTLGFFYVIHPGLHLSKNIGMIIIGIIAIIFVFPALYMIYQEGYDFLRGLRIKMIGSHFADTSRTSTILVAMSTGISRMKKRKGRTIIALSGIVLITFSLTLFTSASTQVSVFSRSTELSTPYNGVYFRTKDWNAPLSEQLLESLVIRYGDSMQYSSRWWLYPPSTERNGYLNITTIAKNASWEGEAILGLTSEEILFQTTIGTLLIEGSWFNRSDSMECIIPDSVAEELSIGINDSILWAGSKFTVIGVVDSEGFDLLNDFDGEALTPKNNRAPSPNVHIKTFQVIILPAETAKRLGASLYSISILSDESMSLEIAETISSTYGRYLEIRTGFNDEVTIHKRIIQNLGQGFMELGIPLAIAILLMINTSISTVYESRKEINIFTSLGLAPFHIAGLFLAEFLVYAIIGSVLGYLTGITSAVVLSAIGLFPESLAINYSSGSVVNALAFGIAGILLSTIYPLRISAKMSVPSVKRSWELKTSPSEDGKEWNIALPFVAATEQEAEGIIEFLHEYFMIYESESVGGTFFAQKVKIQESDKIRKEKHLLAMLTFAPFDMGLKQNVDLFTYLDEIKYRYVFEIKLVRLEGILSAWESSVRRFVDGIRKQLLIWRSLSKEEKAAKADQFRVRINK
jgi:ABC-type antimicrobial peptide transport system permease subunit